MKKLMNLIMLSCRKASGLIVKRENFTLTRLEKIRLFLHLLMCDACTAFSRQSKIINNALEKEADPPIKAEDNIDLPDDLKEKIISKLDL